MLAQDQRRWANIKPTLGGRLVFAGNSNAVTVYFSSNYLLLLPLQTTSKAPMAPACCSCLTRRLTSPWNASV